MMRHIASILLCAGTLGFAAGAASAQAGPPLTTESAQDSYALGQQLAASLKMSSLDINIDALLQGIRDSLENRPARLSAPDLAKAHVRGRTTMMQKHEKRQQELRERHGKEGREFLARNSKQPNVVTTASGLQYTVLTRGTGPRPGPTSKVRFQYKATLLDGTEFDNSSASDTGAIHHIGEGVRALSEVFQLMPAGSKYRVTVPPQLGYGDTGLPGRVPPDATVVYEITLLEIVK